MEEEEEWKRGGGADIIAVTCHRVQMPQPSGCCSYNGRVAQVFRLQRITFFYKKHQHNHNFFKF